MSQRHRSTNAENELSPSGRARARGLAVLTIATGGALLLRPRTVGRWFSKNGHEPKALIIRVLGARQVVQGTAQLLAPERILMTAGAAVDGLHLTSMLGAAVLWRTYRRPALASAAVTTAFAAAGAAIVVSDRP